MGAVFFKINTVSFNRAVFIQSKKYIIVTGKLHFKIKFYDILVGFFLGWFKRNIWEQKINVVGIGIVDGLKHHKNNHSKWSLHKIVSIK